MWWIPAGLWLVALTVCDLRTRRLPNALTLPPAVVVVAAAWGAGQGGAAVAGGLALAGAYLVVHLMAPSGLGAGDVKLALGLGAWTGWCGAQVWLLAALAAPLGTVAAALLCRRRAVPHGPAMCAATALAVALVG